MNLFGLKDEIVNINSHSFEFDLQIQIGIGNLVAAIIIYTDKTAVTGDLRKQAWPIYMSLANIPLKRRSERGGHVFMGKFPDVITNKNADGYISDNVMKMKVFQKCMKLVVGSLKDVAQR